MKQTKRVLAVVLMLCMLIGILPAPTFAESQTSGQSNLTATEIPGLSRLESTDYNGNPTETYADDETVNVIIVMEEPAVLDHFQLSEDDAELSIFCRHRM